MELHNDFIRVSIRDPFSRLRSERFSACAVIEQARLMSGETFCQAEQVRPDRVTCNGVGLVSEFIWRQAEIEALKGDAFPKLGVGELVQILDNSPYDIWAHYVVRPYRQKIVAQTETSLSLMMEMNPVRGMDIAIRKNISLEDSSLVIETILENRGSRAADIDECNHNFVSLNSDMIGKGVALTVPYLKNMERLEGSFHELPARENSARGIASVRGQTLSFLKDMAEKEVHCVFEAGEIAERDEYAWQMTDEASALSISEADSFKPSKFVLWGIEHCLCPEVYQSWRVEPGERAASKRKWTFKKE